MISSGRGKHYLDPHTWLWYHQNLFSDEEFIADVEELKNYYRPLAPGLDTDDLLFSPDYLAAHNVSADNLGRVTDLANRYDTDVETVWRFMSGIYSLETIGSRPVLSFEQNGWIVLKLVPDITRAEFQASWPSVHSVREEIMGKGTRVRLPDNPPLLYAVHKARVRGKSFPEIFRLYQDGRLRPYKGSRSYMSSAALEAYYHRYISTS